MARRLDGITHSLRGLLAPREAPTDLDLLDRFVRDRDGEAFAALVHRHGPMVLSVCRRVLRDSHGAEDAFQATFLVLARRAGSVRRNCPVPAAWLYGVAYRTALEARRAAAVRRAKERRAAEMRDAVTGPADGPPDLRDVLDRELERLPEAYRAAVVLCDLEGLPRRAAADRLGWPEGTLSGRLFRARAMLAGRLSRYGLSVSAGAVAAAARASDLVPGALAESAVRSGLLVAAGRAVAVAAPGPVATLTEGVMKAMFLTKLKALTAAVMVAGAVLTTGVSGWRAGAAPQDQPPAGEPTRRPRDREADRIAALERERDELRKRVAVLERQLADLLVAQKRAESDAAKQAEAARHADAARGKVLPDGEAVDRAELARLGIAVRPEPEIQAPGAAKQPADAAFPKRPGPAPKYAVVPGSTQPAVRQIGQPAAGGASVTKVYPVGDLAADEKQSWSLVRLLQATVEPKSWAEAGGDGVAVYFAAKKALVVRQSPGVQRQVSELLELIREKTGAPGGGAPTRPNGQPGM